MDKAKLFFEKSKSTIILLIAVVIGGIIGVVFKEDATALRPLGTLFINMMQVIVVPLIFLTVSTSIGKIKSTRHLGRLLTSILVVFVVTGIVASFVGFASSRTELISKESAQKITEAYQDESIEDTTEDVGVLERTVSMISTNDFVNLFSKNYMIALMVMSILTGLAIQMIEPKSGKLLEVLDSACIVVENIVSLIMLYAPIGICCYFADFIGRFGTGIAYGYAKLLLYYCIAIAVMYFVVYPIYVFLAGGIKKLRTYARKIVLPSLTAIGTQSSAACIPVSVKAAMEMGVSKEVANTTIPLGVSFHKEGSIIEQVFKIAFVTAMFGKQVGMIKTMGVAILANLLVAGVPMGSGGAASMFVLSMVGCPLSAFPIVTVIGKITDIPQTLLNVAGNNVAAVVVNRIMNGKTPKMKGSKQ